MQEQALASAKVKCRAGGRNIVFVDESGLSEQRTRVKMWAPKGQTVVPQYTFNWKQLSLIADMMVTNFYLPFFHGAMKSPQLVEFLEALARQIRGRLLIIWDGAPTHHSRLVRQCVESLDGRIVLERLPAYAQELSPVEYLLGYVKQLELASLCLRAIDDVRRCASGRLKAMICPPRLIMLFWQQAELPL